MPQRKPYNPNTSYGRKKLREEAERNRQEMSPEEKKSHDGCVALVFVGILVLVLLYILLTGDTKGAANWLTR